MLVACRSRGRAGRNRSRANYSIDLEPIDGQDQLVDEDPMDLPESGRRAHGRRCGAPCPCAARRGYGAGRGRVIARAFMEQVGEFSEVRPVNASAFQSGF